MVVHLSQPSTSSSDRIDTTIDTFAAVSTSQYYGEVVRPQVAFDGTAYTVGARGPGGALRVTRISTSGEVLCGPTPITDIATWGAAASLVSTQQGVVLVATGITGDVVLYRVSQGASATPTPCTLQRGPVMNVAKKRVASSGVFESGELRVSVGDPVILVGKDRAVITAWVERDRTATEAAAAGTSAQAPAESNRVIFRMFGPNLCD
jgi:hypothetical protein